MFQLVTSTAASLFHCFVSLTEKEVWHKGQINVLCISCYLPILEQLVQQPSFKHTPTVEQDLQCIWCCETFCKASGSLPCSKCDWHAVALSMRLPSLAAQEQQPGPIPSIK